MDLFSYRDNQLHAEDVPVHTLAQAYGTPLYIYSANTLRDHYRKITAAFQPLNPLICFSVKSLANLSILRLLAREGSGFDVVSAGELQRALEAGARPEQIVFAGAGKSDVEILAGLQAGIGWFNVEGEQEFSNLAQLARQTGRTTRAALRVNPDVASLGTHAKTLTGKKQTKFGIDIEHAAHFIQHAAAQAPHVPINAIHMHIGSPIFSPEPYVAAVHKGLELIEQLAQNNILIDTFDLGGGFPADYQTGASPPAAEYARAILPLFQSFAARNGRQLRLILEPGRTIACNAGILLTRVEYRKQSGSKRFLIVDAAMNDLIRPTLYEAWHFAWPAAPHTPPTARSPDLRTPDDECVDVVGPVCETGDYLAKDRWLPPMQRGDLLAIFSAGAYGMVMASNYNARPRPAEVLVDGTAHRLIRRRETYDDLVAHERL